MRVIKRLRNFVYNFVAYIVNILWLPFDILGDLIDATKILFITDGSVRLSFPWDCKE